VRFALTGFLKAWIEKDVFMWRVKAVLSHPPDWRLNELEDARFAP